MKEEYRGLRRGSKQSSTGNLLEQAPPVKLTSDPMDYIIYTSIGEIELWLMLYCISHATKVRWQVFKFNFLDLTNPVSVTVDLRDQV